MTPFCFFFGMSAADVAVQAFRQLKPEDFRILLTIEIAMSKHEYVPQNVILKLTNLNQQEISFRLRRLNQLRLVRRWTGPYMGFVLNTSGYDCLAINALVKAGVLEAFGKPLGVGKEADVYDALTPGGKRVAVKFHRLGRTSFRQTRRARGYIAERRHVSWLYQSRLAAEREFEALKIVYPHGVSVPEPIQQNRHVIVMGLIEGVELVHCVKIPNPGEVLDGILSNVRRAYLEAGIIHADLSEYNIVLKPDGHILIIDWPQFVRQDHSNADQLLERDIKNVVGYFRRKFGSRTKLKDALAYVKGIN
ncbi:MAG: RIO-type serine/threonine-protein kinase Rio2 [Candidatus Bathyarchaeota archaeon BA1]|nr:MAG: RIO-type serine/threonine-protein kinase Rio2 [Candidatus Bathyarchaeota archaeon BA1]